MEELPTPVEVLQACPEALAEVELAGTLRTQQAEQTQEAAEAVEVTTVPRFKVVAQGALASV